MNLYESIKNNLNENDFILAGDYVKDTNTGYIGIAEDNIAKFQFPMREVFKDASEVTYTRSPLPEGNENISEFIYKIIDDTIDIPLDDLSTLEVIEKSEYDQYRSDQIGIASKLVNKNFSELEKIPGTESLIAEGKQVGYIPEQILEETEETFTMEDFKSFPMTKELLGDLKNIKEMYWENKENEDEDTFAGTPDAYAEEVLEQNIYDFITSTAFGVLRANNDFLEENKEEDEQLVDNLYNIFINLIEDNYDLNTFFINMV